MAEVAKEVGERPQTVSQWLHRGAKEIPEPDERLSMGPVWEARRIEPWIKRRKAQREGKK